MRSHGFEPTCDPRISAAEYDAYEWHIVYNSVQNVKIEDMGLRLLIHTDSIRFFSALDLEIWRYLFKY